MDLNPLSDGQLADSRRTLPRVPANEAERPRDPAPSVELHAIELELQNRALRETQAELEHAVQRYSDLYDHLPVAYVTMTARGRITEANLAAAELLRCDRVELVGKYLRSFVDGATEQGLSAHLTACLETHDAVNYHGVVQRKDGTRVDVQLVSRLAPARGGAEPLLRTAITDVSALRRNERALEEMTREQEAFSHSASHDLRAPLVTIANYTRLLQTDFESQIPEEARQMLGRVELAAGRMEHLLLMLTEFNAVGRHEFAPTACDARAVVEEVLIALVPTIEATRATVAIEGQLPAVKADRALLAQVMRHLLTNAVKFVPPGRPAHVGISATAAERMVVLAVADDGIGIPAKFHDRIFRVFERLHGYSAYPGAGIGLAVVRRACERMGGRVWVESEPGKGSRFLVELPVA